MSASVFSQFSNNAAVAVKRRAKPSVSVASVGGKVNLEDNSFFSSSTLYCSSVTTIQNNTLPLSPSSRFHNPNHRTLTQNVLALKNSVTECWKRFCCFPLFHHHPSVCVIIRLVAARFSGTPASSIPGFPPPAIKTPPPDSPWAAAARPASGGGG